MGGSKTTYYFFSFACGMVDAICFAGLGGVFVSLMTGNLILMGLAIGQDRSLDQIYAFLVPLVGYATGTYLGGWVLSVLPSPKVRKKGFCVVWALVVVAAMVSEYLTIQLSGFLYFVLVGLLSLASGLQSALLLRTGLQNFASNVMTSTMTSLFADYPTRSQLPKAALLGRLLSILMFLFGVIAGAISLKLGVTTALYLAAVPLSIGILGVFWQSDSPQPNS